MLKPSDLDTWKCAEEINDIIKKYPIANLCKVKEYVEEEVYSKKEKELKKPLSEEWF
jgi:hypothetical protein